LVPTVYSEDNGDFHVVGVLGRHDGGSFQVKSPVGLVDFQLAPDATVHGEYVAGDLVDIKGGYSDSGELVVESVNPGCQASAYVGFVSTPVPTAPAPTEEPLEPPAAPLLAPPDEDDDHGEGAGQDGGDQDEDKDDNGNRGRGNGRGRR
jgi:hypothetical protein